MKNHRRLFSPIVLLVVFAISSGLHCKHENEPDPCLWEHTTTADFYIYETHWLQPSNWTHYDTDTLITYGATFMAKDSGEGIQYEWILGSETLHVRKFYREGFPNNVPIEVKLKVTTTPNRTCFPFDDGVDEKTRQFVVRTSDKWMTNSLVKGKYIGVNLANLTDTFVLEIDTNTVAGNYQGYPIIRGLTSGCSVLFDKEVSGAYREFYFGPTLAYDCSRPSGIARIYGDHDEKIRFDYSIQTQPGSAYIDQRVNKTFIGTRIP